MDTALLREAISKSFGSSHGNPSLQKEALEVLLRWRSSANSERFCLQALQGLLWPDIAPHEQFFFASSLRSTCGKSPLESLQGILPDAVCTLVLLVAGQESDSSTYSQLAFAVAVLAVRCCSWGPTDNVLTELMALHRHAAHNILGHEPHKMERVILVAYLEVLQALPVVASSSAITIHPDRRAMTKAVLAGSPMILPCIQSGLGTGLGRCVTLCLSIMQGWCTELGAAPCGLESQEPLLLNLCLMVFDRTKASASAECLSALFHTCCCYSNPTGLSNPIPKQQAGGSNQMRVDHHGPSPVPRQQQQQQQQQQGQGQQLRQRQLRQVLVCQWTGVIKEGLLMVGPSYDSNPHVQLAVCSVSCAACAAAFGPVLMSAANVQAQGEQQLQSDMLPQFMSLADHLLKQLAQDNDDVALEAANFWTEIYIATLQSLPSSSNGPVNQHFSGTAPRQLTLELALQSPPHAALLQHLASRLVWRTQLKPEDATDATADARDVPEGARMVSMLRRELASALRDIASLVGQSGMLQHVAMLVQPVLQEFLKQADASSSLDTGRRFPQWSRSASGTPPPLPACDWAPLECTLYAANCILNRLEGTALEQLPDSTAKLLVNACTVSVTCPQGSPKLSGTSLTLLAGLAPWYTCRPEGMAAIPSILQAIGHTLQSSDAKLSRNGATSLQRMCHLPALAMHILDNHLAWVDQLLGVYAARGGMQQRAGKLEDSSTEEILLSTLCKLASLARSSAGNLIMQFASLQLTELIKVVGMMADLQLSDAHMIRTSPEYTPSLVPSNQVQLADRLAAVTPTVAQLCSAAALSSRRSSFMSSAGAIKSICDSIMVLTMIVESIEKHGTDEGTAASTSLQPGYQNIQNQLLELVSAVWTMISYMNQTQPCWQQTASAAPIFQATASMMSAALQKSDATTSSKVVQMSLVLLHGLPVNLLIGRGSCSLLSCCMEVYAQLHVPGGGATQTARPPNVQSNSGHDLDPFGSSLRNVVQVCMSAAGNVVLAPFRSRKVTEPAQGSDEDASSLLGLLEIVSTAVIHLPVCLVNFELSNYLPVLDSVLLAVAKAACSSDPDVCRKVLECLELLCCAPFHEAGPADSVQPGGSAAGKQGSKRQEAVRRIFASAPKHKTPSMSTGAAQLREQMDRGGGAKVLLTLLSAASGCMPPNMLLSISSTVHLIWTALGTPRFGAWLRTAIVCDAATLGMPTTAHLSWRRMKNEAKLEFLQELLSEESASDANKFKKHLKTFCGGKKKGGGGNRSVGGSTSYRDTPRA